MQHKHYNVRLYAGLKHFSTLVVISLVYKIKYDFLELNVLCKRRFSNLPTWFFALCFLLCVYGMGMVDGTWTDKPGSGDCSSHEPRAKISIIIYSMALSLAPHRECREGAITG